MKNKQIPITITLTGKRACGKSVMAQYLADIFTAMGANVELIDDPVRTNQQRAENIKYYRSVKKKFYKHKITIKVKTPEYKSPDGYDKGFKTARKYLEIWGEDE